MVSRLSKPAQVPQHTAGIFADMSVDGPRIGTLVAIIDRAKNLPNRKTMGKQNPYCAARLGKEAKKTETDMRGGQTPKWDQELRFTVHDSPDYTQLKVSVFNDDKKTDLIGETWIDIKSVVVPGGGQNDFWHSLQYKGKYAGDIRIELTYYDTRPKDEAIIERRKEAEKVETKTEAVHSGLSGPRQAKPPKRRPLPADPTGSSPARPPSSDHVNPPPASWDNHSTPTRQPIPTSEPPQPQPAPSTQTPQLYETPDDFNRSWGPPPNVVSKNSTAIHQSYQHTPPREVQELPADQYARRPQPPMPPPREMIYSQEQEYNHNSHYQPLDHGQQRAVDQNGYEYPLDPIPHSRDAYQTPPRHNNYIMPAPEQFSGGTPSYPPPSRGSPYGVATETHAQAAEPPPQSLAMAGDRRSHYHQYSSSQANNDAFRESALRHAVNQTDLHPRYEYLQPHVQDADDDGPPPPPPVHRQVFHQQQQQQQHQQQQQQHQQQQQQLQQQLQQQSTPHPPVDYSPNDMGPIQMPEPLNVSLDKTSPVPINDQQTYIAYSPNYRNQNFSSADREPIYSTSPTPSYNTTYRHDRGHSQDRPRTSNGEVMADVPSTLIAGYEAAANEPDRNLYTDHPDRRQSQIQPPPPQPTPSSQLVRASPNSMVEKPPRTSPDLRQIPARKSISPHPPSPKEPGGLSGIPFSPDAYDALNPNVSTASAVQQPAAPYETPEGAIEAARQRELEKFREEGPIIGNDGRVIDPSDHLPADTWAPEPERKSRKPEIVVRFKHAPHNSARFSPRESTASPPTTSSSSAPALVTKARPHSMAPIAGETYSHATAPLPQQAITPTPQARSRLHKQPQTSRPHSHIQPTTTAAIITSNGRPSSKDHMHTQSYNYAHTPSPRPNNALPLRERDPYGYNGNSPTPNTNTSTPPYNNHNHNYNRNSHPHPTSSSPIPTSRHSHSPSDQQLNRHSPYHSSSPNTSIGPPIPAKVPVHSNGGGGELDALSEEMRRIDIGGGNAGRRAGKGRVSYVGSGGGGQGYGA
ncbi:hypothetical protein AJ78_07851 [Emergomyces pasteurianus Ep9510]|uniref:C2 domain-containing protein n=1 Tax=Emergomyces pasteurianus Ep9510 TaxID=1447872 RepID=A0A1J9PU27_9EURO|nr:hypothetical protein AJ78_07851 [Emergomyces pasteurianus Ep9510]